MCDRRAHMEHAAERIIASDRRGHAVHPWASQLVRLEKSRLNARRMAVGGLASPDAWASGRRDRRSPAPGARRPPSAQKRGCSLTPPPRHRGRPSPPTPFPFHSAKPPACTGHIGATPAEFCPSSARLSLESATFAGFRPDSARFRPNRLARCQAKLA